MVEAGGGPALEGELLSAPAVELPEAEAEAEAGVALLTVVVARVVLTAAEEPEAGAEAGAEAGPEAGPEAADELAGAGTGTGTTAVPEALEAGVWAVGLTALLWTTLTVVEVTGTAGTAEVTEPEEAAGTVVERVVVVTVPEMLAVVAGTGTGTTLEGPDEEANCEPTELKPKLE